MLEQISVFTENKKGAMQELLAALAQQGINILGSVTNDSAEYGIVRMILSDPEGAYHALKERGYLCRKSFVLGIELDDTPGSLKGLLDEICDMNINVDYIYLSYDRESGRPVMVMHTESQTEVEEALRQKGYCIR